MRLRLCRARFLPQHVFQRQEHTFNKHYEDGIAHVSSFNPVTREKATLEFSHQSQGFLKF